MRALRISIRYKIFIAFSIVFLFAMAVFTYFSGTIVRKNNEAIINKEMIEARKNLDIYFKQYFIINNLEPTKIAFRVESSNIENELSYKIGSKVMLYTPDGKIIEDTSAENAAGDNKEDLSKAVEGKTAYTIVQSNNKTMVNLCYPVILKNTTIGLIRYTRDYTELFNSSERLLDMIKLLSVIIFVLIFIVSFLLSKHITKPVIGLTKVSKDISQGNLEVSINIPSKDEVGELGESFRLMVDKVKSQIITIEKDRDELRELEKQRKIFFDNVTHELKTPITTIQGYAEIIKDNGFYDEEFFEKGMSYIISESERLNKMVVELLEFSKADSTAHKYNYNPIELDKLLEEVCEEMKIKSKKYNINILCSVQDNLTIMGDWDKLREVFINLIDNSIKYGDVNSEIFIKAFRDSDRVIAKVIDSGEGIPENELNNIFEPFYRINKKDSRERGSSGLGLAIVKTIVEKHKGSIVLESKIKKGTVVTVDFPVI